NRPITRSGRRQRPPSPLSRSPQPVAGEPWVAGQVNNTWRGARLEFGDPRFGALDQGTEHVGCRLVVHHAGSFGLLLKGLYQSLARRLQHVAPVDKPCTAGGPRGGGRRQIGGGQQQLVEPHSRLISLAHTFRGEGGGRLSPRGIVV